MLQSKLLGVNVVKDYFYRIFLCCYSINTQSIFKRRAIMKLQEIDKVIYKKRLNLLTGITLLVLLVTSLSASNILIAFLGSGVEGDHFWLNLIGVAFGLLVISIVYKVILSKPFMSEVNYVRNVKKEMNRIYRKSKLVQEKVAEDHKDALIISFFNLQASKQVYELDSNTLTMTELNERIRLLDEQIEKLGLHISVEDYKPELLAGLKG
jgi:hypothetical protein